MKKVLIIGFACVMTLNMWAERVSVEDAAVVANNFMNVAQPASGVHRAPAKRMVLKAKGLMDEGTNGLTDVGTNGESSEPQYYIYENANGEGWVMVAANDVVRPILAYSHTGSFRTDHMPANIKSWLNGYKKQIAYSAQHATQVDAKVQREWLRLRSGARRTTATPVVAPLIKTGWDQDTPYWNLCPAKNDKHCYTGCVATAMAQVMKYWEWPKQGIGSHTIPGTTYSADFGATTYDWANMKNSYSGSSTAAQKTAVATLMYHCGVAADMEYGTNSSGAYTIDYNGHFSSRNIMSAETALKQFFGYKSTVVGYYRDGWASKGMRSWTRSEWIAMLKSELDAHRPIMYAGAGCDDPNDDNTCYGHSFVCDGYDSNDYFHFNWGWSNWGDGYYDVDALAPTETGAGAGNGEYNLEQDVIVGIEPPETGHEVVKNATGCTIRCTNYAKNGEDLEATITPTDETYDFTSLTVQLGSTTLTLNTDYTLSANHQTLTINASALTGDESDDLTITAVWTKTRYLYALLGENCTPDDLSGTLAMSGVALELTILPDEGYTLADASCWDVEMGDETLVYGTDFTYDASTGAFSIASVTGDVLIFVYGGKSVTWMSNGEVFETNLAFSNIIRLPENEPVACVDKEFVGWTATENYESATVAPTFAEDGDTYSVDTYYAVYATPGEERVSTWDLVTDASTLQAGDVLVIANTSEGKTAGALSSQILGAVSSTFSNNQISSLGVGTLEFTLGGISGAWTLSTADGSLGATAVKKLAWDGGTTTWSISISGGDATIQNGTDSYGRFLYNAGNPRFTTYTSDLSASMLLPQLYRKSNGGTSYTDYTTSCVAPEPVYYNIRFFDKGVQVGETQSVLKNSQPEVPSDPEACDGYTFVGWWGATLPEDNTTAHTWTTDFTATRDTTYYAIYSRTEESGLSNKYEKISLLNELTDGNYVVAGDGAYALKNTVYNNYYLSTQPVSPSNNAITNPGAAIIWQLTRSDNTISFYNAAVAKYAYLYKAGSYYDVGLRDEVYWFNVSVTNDNWSFEASDYAGQYMVYFIYSGNTHEFAAKSSSSTTIKLYKQGTISTTYYSSESCGSTTDIENTTIVPVAQKLLRNGQIVIIRGEAVYTITGERIQ